MISQRWRYNGRGSLIIRLLTSSSVKCPTARVILAIFSPSLLVRSPPLFFHSMRFSMRTAPQSVSRVMHVEKNAASPRAETSLKAAGILAESVELKPCQRLEQPGRARPSVHQTSGQSRDGLLFHGNGRANVARGGGDEHDWQGTVILSRFCGVGDQKEEFIESSLMGKMTFPLLNQGGLEW